jgi:hypothetical protein
MGEGRRKKEKKGVQLCVMYCHSVVREMEGVVGPQGDAEMIDKCSEKNSKEGNERNKRGR